MRQSHIVHMRAKYRPFQSCCLFTYFFSKSSFDIYTYKFRMKEIQLQPSGEPREHRLGEVLQGWSKSKFNIILSFLL